MLDSQSVLTSCQLKGGCSVRGPKPFYQPRFTKEQVECALELVCRHKTPQIKAKRAQLVLLLSEHPDIDCVSAAKKPGMHEQWVRFWRRRWVKEGFSLDDKPRSGRPARFSPLGQGYSESSCL